MISVLLPVYNGEKYLSQSIKSILNQTFRDFEFIIVDDGSIDNTEKIVSSFHDTRIKYIKKDHTGLADTLNYGLKLANYDWVARMDADDISLPERLEKQIKFIDQDNQSIIFTDAIFFKNNKLLFKFYEKLDIHKIKENLILHSPIPHSSVLYNKNFILSKGGYDENLKCSEDYELWLRIIDYATFKYINETLIFTRYSNLSLSRTNQIFTSTVIYNIQNKYYGNLIEENNLLTKKKQLEFLGWREFFFGNPSKAQLFWLKNPLNLLKIRILIAFIISFLPILFSNKFKKINIKSRIKFRINDILGKNKKINNKFNENIKLLNL